MKFAAWKSHPITARFGPNLNKQHHRFGTKKSRSTRVFELYRDFLWQRIAGESISVRKLNPPETVHYWLHRYNVPSNTVSADHPLQYLNSNGHDRTHVWLCPYYPLDRKSTRLNSSHVRISYAVFCLKKKKKK